MGAARPEENGINGISRPLGAHISQSEKHIAGARRLADFLQDAADYLGCFLRTCTDWRIEPEAKLMGSYPRKELFAHTWSKCNDDQRRDNEVAGYEHPSDSGQTVQDCAPLVLELLKGASALRLLRGGFRATSAMGPEEHDRQQRALQQERSDHRKSHGK